jgi:hypothetical protein
LRTVGEIVFVAEKPVFSWPVCIDIDDERVAQWRTGATQAAVIVRPGKRQVTLYRANADGRFPPFHTGTVTVSGGDSITVTVKP